MASKEPVSKEPLSVELAKSGIQDLIERSRGHNVNKAYQIYRTIGESDESARPELLRLAGEQFGIVESSDEIEIPLVIHPSEREQLAEKYGGVADAMLEALIQQNLEEDSFYTRLWDVVNNPFFADDKARGFALYHILIDDEIPYFKVESGLRMADDEFQERLEALHRRSVTKLRFLLARKFEQKTERASLILKHIEEHNEVDRAVLMTYLLLRQAGNRIAVRG